MNYNKNRFTINLNKLYSIGKVVHEYFGFCLKLYLRLE